MLISFLKFYQRNFYSKYKLNIFTATCCSLLRNGCNKSFWDKKIQKKEARTCFKILDKVNVLIKHHFIFLK